MGAMTIQSQKRIDYLYLEGLLNLNHAITDEDERLEPDTFITEIRMKISADSHEDDSRHEDIGEIDVRVLEIERCVDEGVSLFDLFDTETELNYFTPILDESYASIHDSIPEITHLEITVPSKILLIDKVVLNPEYRGQNLGLHAIQLITTKLISEEDMVMLSASPLQFREGLVTDNQKKGLSNDKQYAKERLMAHYRKIGFIRFMDDDNIMIRPAKVNISGSLGR